jgi:hypothetical protein
MKVAQPGRLFKKKNGSNTHTWQKINEIIFSKEGALFFSILELRFTKLEVLKEGFIAVTSPIKWTNSISLSWIPALSKNGFSTAPVLKNVVFRW